MNKKIAEIKELLSLILKKLQSIETALETQKIELKKHIDNGHIEPTLGKTWLEIQKSTKTLLELLRDELEEVHQIMVELLIKTE